MEYRYLGKSGLEVSALSLGAWITWGNQVGDTIAMETMRTAYELGCNFFDNAEVYAGGKAEETMGRCIKSLGLRRSDIVISTKFFWSPSGKGPNYVGLNRKHILESIDESLKRLQLSYVDLLYCHRPDPHTPIEETVRAMNHVINQGKAFYWGTSEWPAYAIAEAKTTADRLGLIGPLMEQPQYSMLHRTRVEKEYKFLYPDLGTTIWSPLACGLLTGKYTSPQDLANNNSRLGFSNAKWLTNQLVDGKGINGLEEKDVGVILQKVEGLKPIASKLGVTLAQLALSWCLTNKNVSSVITGATSTNQVVENFKALQIYKNLTPTILEEIDGVLKNKPF